MFVPATGFEQIRLIGGADSYFHGDLFFDLLVWGGFVLIVGCLPIGCVLSYSVADLIYIVFYYDIDGAVQIQAYLSIIIKFIILK